VALREFVPSATAPLRLRDPAEAGRSVTLVTLLPMAWPGYVAPDGTVLLALQGGTASQDASRDCGAVLEQALLTEPGAPVLPAAAAGVGPGTAGTTGPTGGARLQDLLEPEPLQVSVHPDFGFWRALPGPGDDSGPTAVAVAASAERADAAAVPTERLVSVDAAYWCRMPERAHLRWVFDLEEEPLLDALARLAAAGDLALGPGTRFVGSFRTDGLLVPVWDLPRDASAATWEEPAGALLARVREAFADSSPLTSAQRRARDGLRGRQLTLR